MSRFISETLHEQLIHALHSASKCDHELILPALETLRAVPDIVADTKKRMKRLGELPSGNYVHGKEMNHLYFHLQQVEAGIASFAYLSQFLQVVPDGDYDPRKHDSLAAESCNS